MLYVFFTAGTEKYVIEAACVKEIIPVVPLRHCPGAPEYICGLIPYRGDVAPVVDISLLLAGAPCSHRLSTRIILIRYCREDGCSRLLGLMAERVTQTVDKPQADFSRQGLSGGEHAAFLGRICCDDGSLVQCVHADRLLSADLDAWLFDRDSGGV